MARMKTTTTKPGIKPKKKFDWKLLKRKNSYYQEMLENKDVTWLVLCNALETAESYYLDINGYAIQCNGRNTIPNNAVYMLGRLDGYKTSVEKLQLYAWKCRNADGSFGTVKFGTRFIFESFLKDNIKSYQKQKK